MFFDSICNALLTRVIKNYIARYLSQIAQINNFQTSITLQKIITGESL